MEKKRSIAITILGYLGLLGYSWGLNTYRKGIFNIDIFNAWLSYATIKNPVVVNIVLWIGLFLELVGLVICWNILLLKEMARKALIFYFVFQIIYAPLVDHLFWSKPLLTVESLGGIFGSIAIILFFTRPKVKEQFK